MSDSGEGPIDGVERQALSRLEAAVEQLVENRSELEARARAAESRILELEARLGGLEKGKVDATGLKEAVSELKAQNTELRQRIYEGREGVERLLSRIRFLESQD